MLYLGGIRQSDSAYKRFVIQPWIAKDAGPKWVQGHYDSPHGRIAVRWQKRGDDIMLHLKLPPGTEGTLRLPAVRDLHEGNSPLPHGDVVLNAGNYDLIGVLK